MRARCVLPVPGAPVKITPLMGFAPIARIWALLPSCVSISSFARAMTRSYPPNAANVSDGSALGVRRYCLMSSSWSDSPGRIAVGHSTRSMPNRSVNSTVFPGAMSTGYSPSSNSRPSEVSMTTQSSSARRITPTRGLTGHTEGGTFV